MTTTTSTVPICPMCGASHWPGGAHVFAPSPVLPPRPVRPVLPIPPIPPNSLPSIDTPPELVTVSEPTVFEAPRVVKGPPVYERTPQTKQGQDQSAKMKAYWAKKRAEKAAAAPPVEDTEAVPDWIGPA